MKPNRRKNPREPGRAVPPPEVPEVVTAVPRTPSGPEPDEIPDHIRKMLEAAYT